MIEFMKPLIIFHVKSGFISGNRSTPLMFFQEHYLIVLAKTLSLVYFCIM